MSRHSVGPWQCRTFTNIARNEYSLAIISGDKRLVARIVTYPGDGETGNLLSAEDHCNAKLVAAAPEMLTALEIILFGLTHDRACNGGKLDYDAIIGITKDILNKVQGVQS